LALEALEEQVGLGEMVPPVVKLERSATASLAAFSSGSCCADSSEVFAVDFGADFAAAA